MQLENHFFILYIGRNVNPDKPKGSTMAPKTILTISALLYLIRAIGLMFMPTNLFAQFGVTLDAAATWNAQFLGGVLLGFGVLNWLSRDQSSGVLSAVIVANFIAEFASMIFAIKGTSIGLFSTLGWAPAIQHGVFVLAFGYLLFTRKEAVS